MKEAHWVTDTDLNLKMNENLSEQFYFCVFSQDCLGFHPSVELCKKIYNEIPNKNMTPYDGVLYSRGNSHPGWVVIQIDTKLHV
jgi:hypothetical protein